MKNFLKTHLGIAVFFSCCATFAAPEPTYPEVVAIYKYDSDGRLLSPCTGININGCLVTATHCLFNPYEPEEGPFKDKKIEIAKLDAVDAWGNRVDITKTKFVSKGSSFAVDILGDDLCVLKLPVGLKGAAKTSLLAKEFPEELKRNSSWVFSVGHGSDKFRVYAKNPLTMKFKDTVAQRVGKYVYLGDGRDWAEAHPEIVGRNTQFFARSIMTDNTLSNKASSNTEHGDSGAPIYFQTRMARQIVGLHLAVIGAKRNYLTHVAVPPNFWWIEKNLSNLECRD